MPGGEVRIRRQGRTVVLEPIADDWDWLDRIAGKFSEDFFPDDRNQPPMPPPRSGLDELFE